MSVLVGVDSYCSNKKFLVSIICLSEIVVVLYNWRGFTKQKLFSWTLAAPPMLTFPGEIRSIRLF